MVDLFGALRRLKAPFSEPCSRAHIERRGSLQEVLFGASCRRIFERIEKERALATRWVLAIPGQRELLDEDGVLRRSIRLKNPSVDPLSYP